jgi:hypothetical protein
MQSRSGGIARNTRNTIVNGGGLFVLAGGAVLTLLAGSRAPPRQPPRITDRLGDKHRAVDAAIVMVRQRAHQNQWNPTETSAPGNMPAK